MEGGVTDFQVSGEHHIHWPALYDPGAASDAWRCHWRSVCLPLYELPKIINLNICYLIQKSVTYIHQLYITQSEFVKIMNEHLEVKVHKYQILDPQKR